MRQKRWMKLIRDYDMEIIYHEDKSNVVADALSRKSVHSLCIAMSLLKSMDEMSKMGTHMIQKRDDIGDLTIEPNLYDDIKRKHELDPKIQEWKSRKENDTISRFSIHTNECVRFDGRWRVPIDVELKKLIMMKAYCTSYSVHSGGDKLYKDLKKTFWWSNMKKMGPSSWLSV
ncbi:uncharacterized protein LOC141655366 [Silene latifolia]|uniref:uncharacterized protein LOC141655366 n=1 Tax=Silene latifolia TaxID=37657 RepID=UPI003D771425